MPAPKRIEVETASIDRPGLKRAIAALGKSDVLMVTRLDRLGRSTRDLLNTVEDIAAKKAGFRSLGDAWADTTTPHGRLMLTVLSGLAEFESNLIRARAGEGRERAKERGVKMGRKPKLTAHQLREAINRRDREGETVREIARTFNVSHSAISQSMTAIILHRTDPAKNMRTAREAAGRHLKEASSLRHGNRGQALLPFHLQNLALAHALLVHALA